LLLFGCAGYGVGYDDVIIHGNLDDLKFAAFYTKYIWLLLLVGCDAISDVNC